MALATYSDLQTSFANFLHRADLGAVIPDLIAMAEVRINGDLDARLQDTQTTLATTAGVQTVALPTDLINIRHFSVATDPIITMVYMTPDQANKEFSTSFTGTPINYTVIGSNASLYPKPDQDYGLNLIYKARIPALSITNTSNYLLSTYPNVYLYATLVKGAEYIGDSNMADAYQRMYEDAIGSVNSQDWYSGSTMRVKTDSSQ
jgi:hypothetical protein